MLPREFEIKNINILVLIFLPIDPLIQTYLYELKKIRLNLKIESKTQLTSKFDSYWQPYFHQIENLYNLLILS